ncbi:LuxR family transcriptional regulator/LuxR family transcriptional regulator, quorum-sensing system regulator SolR [Noviherbaspirillum humi]|uniref:LuxR family transcriptional regulator/LuxR family transcriptional regulator, quorum-sensing system regulator SolR n=1 Tax=Noviherbaspirillum humi TaxID=1688639 RepID=A0A239HBN0_9BURK|nr:autoinducer binding domain-containing protein [Noviherbaspirillum humi]SNS78809.1 LuxR family transcriptional regulator/LuxR family transcriptional regulator, quorum-sensing system regulator SolR [Noviherbaspirillum humi]
MDPNSFNSFTSFENLLQTASEEELFDRIKSIAASLGFEYCAYGIKMPVPVSRPRLALFSNYPRQWQECYAQRNYISVDPTVHHGLKSNLPIVWSPETFQSAEELWSEARAYGLRFGWAQASRDPSGAVGMLTLARGTEQIADAELMHKQSMMSWLTQIAHASMTRVLMPKLAPETQVSITPREREVLRWTAEGKTASEIAQIISVSERTVNFHVNNVVLKLGASNKTQAAVKAAALGMLA